MAQFRGSAESLLETEPELKALVEMISKRNAAENASTQLIRHFLHHTDDAVMKLPETRRLLQDWLDAVQPTIQNWLDAK